MKTQFQKLDSDFSALSVALQTAKPGFDLSAAVISLCEEIRESGIEGEEMPYIGELSAFDLASFIVGAYWAFSQWHGGQSSPEYAALSALSGLFKPGGTSGPEPESSESFAFDLVNDYFIARAPEAERIAESMNQEAAADPDSVSTVSIVIGEELPSRVEFLNDYGDSLAGALWLFGNEFGPVFLVQAQTFQDAWEAAVDASETISVEEAAEIGEEGGELPEGYTFQANFSGTGIVNLGHYAWQNRVFFGGFDRESWSILLSYDPGEGIKRKISDPVFYLKAPGREIEPAAADCVEDALRMARHFEKVKGAAPFLYMAERDLVNRAEAAACKRFREPSITWL